MPSEHSNPQVFHGGGPAPGLLTLVTRQDCHLCEQALAMLRGLGFEPELADVDADEGLHERYDWRVPVVLLDGRVIAEGRIDRERLERVLRAV